MKITIGLSQQIASGKVGGRKEIQMETVKWGGAQVVTICRISRCYFMQSKRVSDL